MGLENKTQFNRRIINTAEGPLSLKWIDYNPILDK